ncbi:MAG: winged helix DNA-binding domain-containing protein [Acidobacteria bacterium]|nr:winged helix DNA-binding domain-containing protein [Acidobacteriota bacterium]
MAAPIDIALLRAWWASRQGLDGSLSSSASAEVLERTGWARSVGGTGPYLTLHARAGLSRPAVDADVAALKIHELPAARGCTYVCPASHFALALAAGRAVATGADRKLALKLGATEKELEKLTAAVLAALKAGPFDPEQIKLALGGAVRSVGDEGKKKGLTTSLPVVLGELQSSGRIRRIPINGRLDQQRYRYALWHPNPCSGFKLSQEECATSIARLYWGWIGPAALAEFQWFSGFGVKVAKQAIEPLHLVATEFQWFSGFGVKVAKQAIEPLHLVAMEPGSDRLILPADLDSLRAFKPPKEPSYALVSSIDALMLLRRNVSDLLDQSDREIKLIAGVADLPSHAIVDRGRIIGLWEYDTGREEIVWMTFEEAPAALHAEIARVAGFIRADLGDARSFSLDSPKSRSSRITALRKLQA